MLAVGRFITPEFNVISFEIIKIKRCLVRLRVRIGCVDAIRCPAQSRCYSRGCLYAPIYIAFRDSIPGLTCNPGVLLKSRDI